MNNRKMRPWYRVVTAIDPPFIMYNSSSKTFYGYCIDLLNDMQSLLAFDYDIRESPDQQFGYMEPATATWNGMIYELITNQSDLAVGSLWLSSDRERVVDFTMPFYRETGFTIMMLKTTKSVSLVRFLRVFEVPIWLGLALAFLSSTFLIYALERYSPFSYKNNRGQDRFSSLKECFWFTGSGIGLAQGCRASSPGWPRNLSGRVATATWWLFVFVIAAAYTANLAAYETLARLERHIRSLDDLSRQYQIDYSILENSSLARHIDSMKDLEYTFYRHWKKIIVNEKITDLEKSRYTVWEYPLENKYTKMYNLMREHGFLSSVEQAVEMVKGVNRTRQFAYIGESVSIRYNVLQNCDLTVVGDEFWKRPLGFAVQKGSPLKKLLDQAMNSLHRRGRMDDLEKKWWDENPLKYDCPIDKECNAGFDVDDMAGVFLLILAGIFVSCMILCTQYLAHWYSSRRRWREQKGLQLSFQTRLESNRLETKRRALPAKKKFSPLSS